MNFVKITSDIHKKLLWIYVQHFLLFTNNYLQGTLHYISKIIDLNKFFLSTLMKKKLLTIKNSICL